MNYSEVRQIGKDLRRKPFIAVIVILVLIICAIIIAVAEGFFHEKGRQIAGAGDSLQITKQPHKQDEIINDTETTVPSAQVGDIRDNENTQVNINSPNSRQIVNQMKCIKEARQKKRVEGQQHILTITLIQRDGIWSAGQEFKIQVHLSGPFQEYDFVQGFPMALFNVRKGGDNLRGIIDFATLSAPLNGPIVLEIKSDTEIDVTRLFVTPHCQ